MNSPFKSQPEREQDRDNKREAVLQAAVRLFNDRGFGATSLEEVAMSLKISKPTIYYYLGNKERVLLECVTRGLKQLQEAARAARDSHGQAAARLQSFMIHYACINMSDFGRCIHRTQYHDLSPDGAAEFRRMKRMVDVELRHLLEEAVADGSIAPCDIKFTAFAIAGALNGPAFWFDPLGTLAAEDVARALVEFLIAGLAPRT